jgi:predicted nucleotidyltransferase component of viral defense system
MSRKDNNTKFYRFESEFPPIQKMKIKVEPNCREHFSVLGWEKKPFSVIFEWFKGDCYLTTYTLEELLGTKQRALYQRRKGRDLFDLWKAITNVQANFELVVKCYKEYMSFTLDKAIPTKKQFILNLETKRYDAEFLGDTVALLCPDEKYNRKETFILVLNGLV